MDKWHDKNTYKKLNTIIDILGAVFLAGMIILTIIRWHNAPETIPTHYNFRGEADGYGSRSSLLILLLIEIISYIILGTLSKYPQIYNYCIPITPENKEKQFLMAGTFMKILNTEIAAMFFYIQLKEFTAVMTGKAGLSPGFMIVFLIVIFGSTAFYIIKSIKNK